MGVDMGVEPQNIFVGGWLKGTPLCLLILNYYRSGCLQVSMQGDIHKVDTKTSRDSKVEVVVVFAKHVHTDSVFTIHKY
jgi:hypothetical protein